MMLAPETKEITVENINLEGNLFDGLNFPQVPSNAIIIKNKTNSTMEHHTIKDDTIKENYETVISYRKEVVNEFTERKADITQSVVSLPSSKKTVNFSALYSSNPNEIKSESNQKYPDLPNFIYGQKQLNSTINTSSTEESESASLLSTENSYHLSNLKVAQQVIEHKKGSRELNTGKTQTFQNEIDSEEHVGLLSNNLDNNSNELVSELMDENARLTQELQRIRTSSTKAGIPHQTMNPLVNNESLTTTTTTLNANLTTPGIKISDTSQPPKEGVKYVCCGNCKQWLCAPRAANFVVCTMCDAINNCKMAPEEANNSLPEETESRALNARQNSRNDASYGWLFDCISRPFR